MALACLHAFIRNQGDGWSHTQAYLERYLDEVAVLPAEDVAARKDPHAMNLAQMRKLGERTAELHKALCPAEAEPDFKPEPLTEADVKKFQRQVGKDARAAFDALAARRKTLAPEAAEHAEKLLAKRKEILEHIEAPLAFGNGVMKTRFHGDYHLGQVVVAQNDFYILDFEGEPRRPLAERRAKHTPLKDVAGMLRSFAYAKAVARRALAAKGTVDLARVEVLLRDWHLRVSAEFATAYRVAMAGCAAYPANPDEARRLLTLATLQRLLYELRYELDHRPDWLVVPLEDLERLISSADLASP
jgi:maltose alpha-D-glucosyltransferase/alpha-amylase